ncbi:MAG TPA: nitrilase-related carbon-nitrogen hydrolase [Bacteroidota bacterium]|nr:nitrilase-related carbon-nitrogen hydrolase [Bacteroidota bacterium]
MTTRLALAQIDPVLGDIAKNVETHAAFAERARAQGAKLAVFPELSLTGYSVKDMHWELCFRPSSPPSSLAPLLDLSKGISLLVGGISEGEDYGIYNSAFLIEGGTMRTVHRKIYPPTYGMFEELRYFSAGRSVQAIDTSVGRIGVLICEDLWHLSLPYLLAADGATTIITLVASPTRVAGPGAIPAIATANGENHRALARLLSVFLVFCNRVGIEDGVSFWGGSEIVSPDGENEVAAKLFDQDLVVGDIDDDDVRRARRFSRHFLDEDLRLVESELRRILRQQDPARGNPHR